jgi:hypothetical protein
MTAGVIVVVILGAVAGLALLALIIAASEFEH